MSKGWTEFSDEVFAITGYACMSVYFLLLRIFKKNICSRFNYLLTQQFCSFLVEFLFILFNFSLVF